MKILHLIIGILIIFIGSLFMSITVNNEVFKTIINKIVGFVILVGGIIYLRKLAKFGQ
ncbi:hypothetical protein H9636_15630 [Ureibacillus sp. Re31]|uniref:Uncharacterized protein n=1 Tax=Ureibacillus galli TaxID=2762222 RepID=A0ABR8XFU0_9BACL|nr:hypothetical protein [Ureibacillus galli]MBD8028080.1 hypothetical protein [Ureibacillus galli]